MSENDARYTVPAEVLSAHLDGEAVLLHMGTKSYFRLNDTAALIFGAVERGLGREAILDELCASFEVERPDAAREMDRLLADLAARGLAVPEGGAA